MASERMLVFAPGTSPRPCNYYLPEHPEVVECARVTPIALINLQAKVLNKRLPDEVIALCTQKVMAEVLPEIEVDFARLGIPIRPLLVPDGKTEQELKEMVKILLHSIPDECELLVDITHGFRSGPFVFSVAVQYLSFLRPSVEIEGLYYGMMSDGSAPLVNLQVFLDLMDWLYAVRVFRDTFIPQKLAEMMESLSAESDEAARINESIALLANIMDLCLPLDLAEAAAALRQELSSPLPDPLRSGVLLADELFGEVAELASVFAPDGDRDRVPEVLDREEINRQIRVIDKYTEAGRLTNTVGMVFEWITTMIIYHNGDRAKWRTRDERRKAGGLRRKLLLDRDSIKAPEDIKQLRHELHHYRQQEPGEILDETDLDLAETLPAVNNDWEHLKALDEQAWKVEP
ncbi:MAG: CRISPR-associated DxTHG motif protein [Limnochordia bacterium]|jgi:CRISPR-associated DxTHG motif protein